jgi:hypothetical protein
MRHSDHQDEGNNKMESELRQMIAVLEKKLQSLGNYALLFF